MKAYLGDGVYLDCDGYALVLTTEDGVHVTNRIVLEPAVYHALTLYVDDLVGFRLFRDDYEERRTE
jgi:hypothetical protein